MASGKTADCGRKGYFLKKTKQGQKILEKRTMKKIFKKNCINMKMDDLLPSSTPVLIALSLASICFYIILPVMERKVLCSVSCLDSCCEAPHFVYQWTFQPIPSLPSFLLLPPLPPLSVIPFTSSSLLSVVGSLHHLFVLI